MMKKFYSFFLVAAIAVLMGSVSCSKDNNEAPADGNTGISNRSWADTQAVGAGGDQLIYNFTAAADWKATSSEESWCMVTTGSGKAGNSGLRITVKANAGVQARTAIVTVAVSGYSAARFTISQSVGGNFVEINKFVSDHMKQYYLWNEQVANLTFDYSLYYTDFLTSILTDVAAQGDANHDDGHWEDGKRAYFYSNISSEDAPDKPKTGLSTRAGELATDTGIWDAAPLQLDDAGKVVGFAILAVVPGQSADKAGIHRGSFINKVNGQLFTDKNIQELAYAMLFTSCKVTVNDVVFDPTTGRYKAFENTREVSLAPASYVDPAIYMNKVLDVAGKRVGYMLYMGFDTSSDQALIAAFKEFKDAGISELILDLRYNGGGAVVSSAVLSTMIAGNAYKGQVYAKTTYNKQRAANGEIGYYKIGTKEIPGGAYSLIESALSSAVNLKTIYVLSTVNTASASELIINGLRGLDLEVRLIGTQTNGKNVGMESRSNLKKGKYTYTFMPITFYSENAKGFKDYSNGFTPDVIYDAEQFYPSDFLGDMLVKIAAKWIETGTKPVIKASLMTRGAGMQKLHMDDLSANRRYQGMYVDRSDLAE